MINSQISNHRILILGGTGMLGHMLWRVFHDTFPTYITVRTSYAEIEKYKIFKSENTIENIDVTDITSVRTVLERVKPSVVINAVGIVKQLSLAKDKIASISINALFPHLLANECFSRNIRMLQISTDCVFSGEKGNYDENDISDANDLYGRTKYLGEVHDSPNVLTIRTSIIGHELYSHHSLLDWFLSQKGSSVKGYRNARFSGFTTQALARILKDIIMGMPKLNGLYHVASTSISKYDLLQLINQIYKCNITITPDNTFNMDRTLNGKKFLLEYQGKIPDWTFMINDLFSLYPYYQSLMENNHAH